MKIKRVLFLLPYPLDKAPSQRFRIEAYFNLLKQNKIHFSTQVFLNENGWSVLYKNGSLIQKVLAVIKGFSKRFYAAIFLVHQFDFIVVHREVSPLGPPIFEWIIARLWKRKIIFDFDDAIWIPNTSEQNKLAGYIKCFWKTASICRWAYKISAGNQFLASFARNQNKNVFIIPTAVDISTRYNKLVDHQVSKPAIGWTGSHSTLKYLDIIYPVLGRLNQTFDYDFLVICNKPPATNLKNLKFIEWNEESEITDLAKINIGIMPLYPDQWSEGKCGFKIIQYLALGIPSVASPVGVNKIIVEDGINGFLCNAVENWYQALSKLLKDASLREKMGLTGRQKIIKSYSVQANEAVFLSLFD